MTCPYCNKDETMPNSKACESCLRTFARHGSGRAKVWTSPDEVDRDPAKIAENKRIGAERVKRARLQGRAT